MGLFDKPNGGNENNRNRLKRALEAASSELNLTADQQQKIEDIFRDFQEERLNIKGGGSDSMNDDLRTARQETRHKVMDVLNNDQKKVLIEHLHELREDEE